MGWMSESDDHEGYLRGFEPLFPDYSTTSLLREITSSDADKRTIPLRFICAACECGWRSARWPARSWWYDSTHKRQEPEWTPCIVTASPEDEEIGVILWNAHERASRVDPIGPARLLARARLGSPETGARIIYGGEGDDRRRNAVVLASSLPDRAGRNLRIVLDAGEEPDPGNPTTRNREAWIRSTSIVELR